jgi:16S rRNA (cytosine1402-N4)-methyltransferase
MSAPVHIPVLLQETLEALAVQPGGRYIDCTVGGGGHAAAILGKSAPGGQLLGLDADAEAIKSARRNLAPYRDSVLLVNDNFCNLRNICIKYDFHPVHGIFFDLGLSSLQLGGLRGFSFQSDRPLDMRFSTAQDVTAADIVNTFSEEDLARILRTYGEESSSDRIARRIVQQRPINTTLQLAEAVTQAVGGHRGHIHPATKTFQALRIAVNHELEHLKVALRQAISLLGYDGRLVVISYHSLEDRIVKQILQEESRDCLCPPQIPTCICGHKASLRIITKKIVAPTLAEVQCNPRSRSAKLRAAERPIAPDAYLEAIEDSCFSDVTEIMGWRRPSILKRLRVAFSAI